MSTYELYESEYAGETLQEWELTGESVGEYSGEYEGEYQGEFEGEFEGGQPGEYESGQFGEYERDNENESELEYELAHELLEITTEAELEQFIGKLVKSAGKFMKSGVGKAIGGVLKSVAKTALPMVGSALGSMVLPGVGTALGGKLGSMASKLLEVGEAETMGEAEAELEAAVRFVRFGRAAARHASMAPPSVPPRVIARSAAVAAARRHAPALLRPSPPTWRDRRATRWPASQSRSPGRTRSPRWQWSGNRGRPVQWARPPVDVWGGWGNDTGYGSGGSGDGDSSHGSNGSAGDGYAGGSGGDTGWDTGAGAGWGTDGGFEFE